MREIASRLLMLTVGALLSTEDDQLRHGGLTNDAKVFREYRELKLASGDWLPIEIHVQFSIGLDRELR